MAWRSWNAFLADIDDPLIRQNIEALVAKTRSAPDSLDLAPGPSLWDAGYTSIGIDEGERHRRCCSVLASALILPSRAVDAQAGRAAGWA
jgi:hypothetical protein